MSSSRSLKRPSLSSVARTSQVCLHFRHMSLKHDLIKRVIAPAVDCLDAEDEGPAMLTVYQLELVHRRPYTFELDAETCIPAGYKGIL